MKIGKSLGIAGLLKKGVSEITQNEAKKKTISWISPYANLVLIVKARLELVRTFNVA